MDFETFKNKYDLIAGKPETINSGTSNVMFNKRRIFLRDQTTLYDLPTTEIIDDIELTPEIKDFMLYKIFQTQIV